MALLQSFATTRLLQVVRSLAAGASSHEALACPACRAPMAHVDVREGGDHAAIEVCVRCDLWWVSGRELVRLGVSLK